MTARIIPALLSHLCPQCLAPMVQHADGYYVCTNNVCLGEFWPDPLDRVKNTIVVPSTPPYSSPTGLTDFTHRSLSLQEGEKVPPGGSKSGKKYGGKEKMKKKTTQQLYENLSK